MAPEAALLAGIGFLGALVFGITGFGSALVTIPLATHLVPLEFALASALYTPARRGPPRVMAAAWAGVVGLAGGIPSSLFGAGGPPYAIYLSQRGLTKEQFRATMGFATMTSISLRVAAFAITGLLLDSRVWLTALVAVPAGLLALWVARRIYRRISRELLMRAVALVLLASGSSLVLRALH